MKLQVTLTVEQGDVDEDIRFLRVCQALELVREMGELVMKSDGEVTVSAPDGPVRQYLDELQRAPQES